MERVVFRSSSDFPILPLSNLLCPIFNLTLRTANVHLFIHFSLFHTFILIIFILFLAFFYFFCHLNFVPIPIAEQPTSLLPIDFDPIVITLVWDETFISFEPDTTNPLSIDRVELHDITGQHMVEALKAELHDNDNYGGVQFLDLSVSAGLPNYDTRTLPLTLTGQVTFQNIRQAILDPASLHRVLLQAAFKNTNANELYLFRLKIANDPTLQNVVSVLAGKDELIQYTLQHNNGDRIDFNDFSPINTDTSTEEGFVSVLLIVIIVAVGVSIIAVVCFIYCLICRKQSPGRRSRTSGKAAKTLEENSLVDQLPPSVITGIPTNINGRYRKSDKQQQKKEKKKLLSSSTNKSKNNNNNNKRRSPRQSNRGRGRYASMSASSHVSDDNDKNNNYYDKYGEVPAVRTAPTQEMMMGEEGGGEYDIEFNFAGSNIDDGISEYDMETLPPPSTHVPDTDDEASQVDDTMMSIMDGMVDNVDDYNNYNNGDDDDDDSDDKTVASSNVGGDYDDNISDAGTSLYSYIPDDTSLTASLVNGPFSSQYQKKQPDLQQQQQQQTTMERAQKKSILWSVMDSLNVTKAPPDASDTDNEGESVYIDDMTFIADDYNNKEKNFNSSTTTAIMKNNHTKTMLGNEDNDSFTSSKDSNSLLYKNTAEVEAEAVVNAAPKYPEEKKKQFEQVWKQDTTATTEDANATSVVVEKEASIQATTPEKEENNGNSEEMAAVSTAKRGNKTIESNIDTDIDNIDARGHDDDNKEDEIADATAVPESSDVEDSQPKEGASASEAVVDWVPEEKKVEEIDDDGGDEDEDNNRFLPLPTTLESSFLKESGIIFDARDVSSVSSGVSETSHQSNASNTRKGESARRKKSSKWGATAATSPSSASVVSCGGSVCSTDSSKLRSLLGQSDTNDAALVFGKQQPNSTNKNDESSSSAGSNATPESEVSMSSCTSNQLKSLLTRTDSRDSAEDEDFLFRQNKETIGTNNDVIRRTVQEEEKKEDFVDEENYDDDDDDDSQKNAYLPVSIRPVTPSQNNYDDDSTAVSVYSALSDAPSVDESISSNMGWF